MIYIAFYYLSYCNVNVICNVMIILAQCYTRPRLQPTTLLELQLGAWDVGPCSISNKDVCLIRLMMLILQIASLVPEINA